MDRLIDLSQSSCARFVGLLCAVAVALFVMPASAEYADLSKAPALEKSGEKDVALIVGVEDYVFLPGVEGNAEDDSFVLLFGDAVVDESMGLVTFGDGDGEDYTMVWSASLDFKQLLENSKQHNIELKEARRGTQKTYVTKDFELALLAGGLVWVSAGEKAYRDASWEVVANNKPSAKSNKHLAGLVDSIDTSRGLWVVGDAALFAENAAMDSPPTGGFALSADIDAGLVAELLLDMSGSDEAKSVVKELEEAIEEAQNRAMMSILGFKPLLANLEMRRSGARVSMESTMTESEVDTMIQSVDQLIQSQQQ